MGQVGGRKGGSEVWFYSVKNILLKMTEVRETDKELKAGFRLLRSKSIGD